MSNALVIPAGIVEFIPTSRRHDAAAPEASPAVNLEQIKREAAIEAERVAQARIEADKRQRAEKCRQCGAQFDALIKNLRAQITEQVIRMSVRVAEIIVRHQLPDRDMIAEIIRKTLDPISDLQGAKVRMHPRDITCFRAQAANPAAPIALSERVELVADPSLGPGDVVIESRNGIFDARLSQRLALLEQSLMERGKNHADDH